MVALVMLTAAPSAEALSILLAPSEADNPGFRASVAAHYGDVVDYFDARTATPSLALLNGYDAVFTWANFSYDDPTGFGNVLAAYVDGGRRVILGAFTTYTNGNSLSGQIMTAGYAPVVSPTGSNLFAMSNYVGDGTSGLWTGVGSYGATYRDNVVLQGSGVADGHFADGAIAAAYRPDFGVIYLGGMESITATTGDATLLLANAARVGATVPEPSLLALLVGGLATVARRRRSSLR